MPKLLEDIHNQQKKRRGARLANIKCKDDAFRNTKRGLLVDIKLCNMSIIVSLTERIFMHILDHVFFISNRYLVVARGFVFRTLMVAVAIFIVIVPVVHADTAKPLFATGEKQNIKNNLVFVWSSNSRESADIFNKIILPLNDYVKNKKITVVSFQVSDGTKNDNGTGPIFLCAEPDEYAKLSERYWKEFDGDFKKVGNWYIASKLILFGHEFGLPEDVAKCHDGKKGAIRRENLKAWTLATNKVLHISKAPALFLNSKRIFPKSPQDIVAAMNK